MKGGWVRMPSGRPQNQKRRRRIRDTSEVSCCLKYVIFGFNVIFWVRAEATDLKVFILFLNSAPWIGNPGHRDLGLVREGHLQQPQQAHQHRPRPCLHLHMGWRHHLHYWSVPFDISSTTLVFSICYCLFGEKFG